MAEKSEYYFKPAEEIPFVTAICKSGNENGSPLALTPTSNCIFNVSLDSP